MTHLTHHRGYAKRCMLLLFLVCAFGLANAADVPCGVGVRVQGDFGAGAPGEIAEVGTEPPHVGWYRIVFGWNAPNGDWYYPVNMNVTPQGSSDRCVVAASAAAASPAKTTPSATSAPAGAELPSTERCPRGNAVVDRQQRRGEILGERNGMCVVRLADGSSNSYLNWMLSADTGAAAVVEGLPAGTYVCSADGAGMFRIELDDGNYVDRAGEEGSYSIDDESGMIEFDSGSLEGYHSKVLGPGKFGLAAAPTTLFYTVCNLQSN